jgi:general secretion pathway protein J
MTGDVRARAGFTLLEILVALVVLGFLMVGLTEGVRFGLHAWNSEAALVNRRAGIEATERVLRGLIAAAEPGDVDESAPFHGQAHTLSLVTRLPMSAPGLVTRNAEVGLGVDSRHRLVLRWSPHPHAERLTKLPPPQETVMLEGVDHIAFSYLRWPNQGGTWVDTWDLQTLPQLVRITIEFPKDDRRHWPTIEAAPMLSRLNQ